MGLNSSRPVVTPLFLCLFIYLFYLLIHLFIYFTYLFIYLFDLLASAIGLWAGISVEVCFGFKAVGVIYSYLTELFNRIRRVTCHAGK